MIQLTGPPRLTSTSQSQPIPGGRRAAGRLARLCLIGLRAVDDGELQRLVARSDADSILALAAHHRIEGWLYERLRTVRGVDADLVRALKVGRDWAARRHLYGVWQLGRVRSVLETAGIPWVIVKGPILAELLYGSPGLRTYHDLDVLVKPRDFRGAVESLEGDGAVLMDRNWPLLLRERRGQVHLKLHGGMELDLHWDLVNVHRRRMTIDTQALLSRRVEVEVGGLRVPTLEAADGLIHIAVHAAVSGGDLLVWIKDIERAVAVRPPSWDDVVARSRAWRVSGAVGLMLERARRVLQAGVPQSVPAELLGAKRLSLVQAMDRRAPVEASRGGPSPARFMARLIGHGAVDGMVVLGQRVFRHFDPREPQRSSPFTPAGDIHDREAYLSAVEAAAPDA